MVVKPCQFLFIVACSFESSVISYGSQTLVMKDYLVEMFESSVISYGSQTAESFSMGALEFESSVISYGSQTTMPD